jgi:parallel beta-helix repeat protein
VSFENLTIGLDSPGEPLHTLHCIGASHVEINRSLIDSKARFAVLVSDNASLNARDSTFQTAGAGCGLKFENNSRGSLLRCAFSSNRWGLEALNSAQAQITSCSFQNNGPLNGDGSVLVAAGAQARIDADHCQFTGNTASLRAIESGSLSITNSSFKDNGVTGEAGNVSGGLISVQNSGKATLSNLTFESNKQGIAVVNGGSVTISGCHFSNTGIRTGNAAFQYLSNVVSVAGQGSSGTVNLGTTISNSTGNGIFIVEGARLTLDDASVEGSALDGLWVGNNKGGATADVRRGKFMHNRYGIACVSGSSGTIQDCKIVGNNAGGVWLGGANTKGTVGNSEFRGNKLRWESPAKQTSAAR